MAQAVGLASAGEVLGHAEIAAWITITGVPLSAGEVTAIRSISAAYVGAARTLTDVNAQPPYMTDAWRKRRAAEYAKRRRAQLTGGQ